MRIQHLLLAGALFLIAQAPAHAQVGISVSIPGTPVRVDYGDRGCYPVYNQPVYSQPVYYTQPVSSGYYYNQPYNPYPYNNGGYYYNNAGYQYNNGYSGNNGNCRPPRRKHRKHCR
ncbi:MAG: hypothetical protein AB1758_32115 [Candidatus Eremiobacterota bacterium]